MSRRTLIPPVASAAVAAAISTVCPVSSGAGSGGEREPPALVSFTEVERRRISGLSPLPPVPPDPTNSVADDPRAAGLGRSLFFDTRLSGNGEVSCATCHDPGQAFTDGRQLAEGIGAVTRHTMSLWNLAYNRWFFWDGRADTLWSQALVPIEHPLEHGADRLLCAHVVHRDPGLRAAYETVFGPMPDLADERRFPPHARPVPEDDAHPHHVAYVSMAADDRQAVDRIFANLGKAIAAYERRLVSRRSPFDVFVEGLESGHEEKLRAISPAAQRGLKLFVGRANCRLCHLGPNLTDGEFHSTGVPPLGGGALRDPGRYDGIRKLESSEFSAAGPFSDDPSGTAADRAASVIRSSETWGQFKTPSLRNVAVTAPYMHQGQFQTLEDVLRHYSTLEDAVLPGHHREQLLEPLNLTERDIADLIAFLRALTDTAIDEWLLKSPTSPEEGSAEKPG